MNAFFQISSVHEWIQRGLPKRKIVISIDSNGVLFKLRNASVHGVNAEVVSTSNITYHEVSPTEIAIAIFFFLV